MKNLFLSRVLVACVVVALTTTGHSQATCPLNGGVPQKPVGGIAWDSYGGTATLCGFSEFTSPSTPPKKYKSRLTSGTQTNNYYYNEAVFGYPSNCPLYPLNLPTTTVTPFQLACNVTSTVSATVVSETASNITYAVSGGAGGRLILDGGVITPGNFTFPKNGSNHFVGVQIYCYINGGWVGLTPFTNYFQVPPRATVDTWNIVEGYSSTCAPLATTNTSNRTVNGSTTAWPFGTTGPSAAYNAALATVTTPNSTTRTTTGTNNCYFWNAGYTSERAIQTGTVSEMLTDEDTEDMAEQRVTATHSSLPIDAVAFRTSRTGFSFSFRRVHYKAVFQVICPGDYDVWLNYSNKAHGTTTPVTQKTVITRRTLASGPLTVQGDIKVEQYDTDYTLDSIELHKPSCDGEEPPAHPEIEVGSVKVGLSLGRDSSGVNAGYVRLDAATITAATYTPAALKTVTSEGGGVTVIRDAAGAVRQVKAPQTFVDVVTLSATSYEARFYGISDVGAQDPVTKIYTVGGTAYAVYKFENPDTGVTTRLRLTETRGATVRVNMYAYDVATNTWSLSTGNGLRQENTAITTGGGDTVRTTTIRDAANNVVSKTKKTVHTFTWGDETTQIMLDPDGSALTTNYIFYSNSGTDGTNYGHLKEQTNADGSWVIYTYDSTGRVLKAKRPFLDAVDTAADSLCRVTTNTYGTLADADGDALVEQLTTTVETTLGQETARSYAVDWSKAVVLGGGSFTRHSDIRSVTIGAVWNAASNLVTETLAYTGNPYVGRTRRIVYPDGTATMSSYFVATNGQETATVKTGQPNGTLDDIVAGTSTITLTSAQGQVISQSVTDIASGLTLSSWVASTFDALNRATRIDYPDGTYETKAYACCGLSTYRDRSGLVTTYQFDDLGRQTDVTSNGLTTHTNYDAEGWVKSVVRIGTDTSQIALESNDYDLAGRLITHRDALNRPTGTSATFNSGNGHLTRTTTNPDTGTRIEVDARDGSILSVSGTAVAPLNYEYGVETDGLYTKEIRVGDSGAVTEWTKTYTDLAGRAYKTVLPDAATTQSYFNTIGQLVRQVDADGVTTLFAYNSFGDQETTAVDLNANNAIDFNGTDRVTKSVKTVATKTDAVGTFNVQRTTTQVWEADNVDTGTIVTISEQTADGLHSWQTLRGLTTSVHTAYDGSGGRTIATTTPDGVKAIQVYAGDHLSSNIVKTGAGVQLMSTTYAYDPHGRLQTSTDARNGATGYTYYDDGQIHAVTTPDPDSSRSGAGYDPQVTTYNYNSTTGRLDSVTQPDTSVVNTSYWPTGAIKRTWGSRTYPIEYAYDPQGRIKTLTTWQNFTGNSGQAVTTWNYNPQRGWLDNKRYADSTGPTYTYTSAGRLHTRIWARTPTITTMYGYNAAGDLGSITYSDGTTPNVTMGYDRSGRPNAVTDGSGARILTYTAGQLDTETYTSGLLSGLSVDRSFDSLNRLSAFSSSNGSTLTSQTYGYDDASRLQTLTAGSNIVTYGFSPNSALISTVTYQNSGTTRLAVTKTYDSLNRLASISSAPSGSAALSYTYDYNAANQRIKVTRENSDHWNYGYDALGQVTSGTKYDSADAPLPGHNFGWTYDDIGNRKTSTVNSQPATYTPNTLNQYLQRTVPGVEDVLGAASSSATVTLTLNGGTPQTTTRHNELFFKQLAMDNSMAAQVPTIAITGVKNGAGIAGEDAVTTITKTPYLPKNPEGFSYDTDGNLISDARWTYKWDAENRLISMENSTLAPSGVANQKLEFDYDMQGRRVSKKVSNWNGSVYVLGTQTVFLYDGWNMVAELNALSANSSLRTYVWGLDLSGSFQSAGGVGGLLLVSDMTNSHFAAYDGNGNVTCYVTADTGAVSGSYDYSVFGDTIVADGAAKDSFTFRFSTKFYDVESGHYYYGMRYYVPLVDRWLSRDPTNEDGGINLYAPVSNDAVNKTDMLGMWSVDEHYDIIRKWLLARTSKLPRGSTYTRYHWHCYVINVEQALMDGNDDVDGTGSYTANFMAAQSTANSYQHAMRAPGQSVSEARALMMNFISGNEATAQQSAQFVRSLLANGNPSEAGGEYTIVSNMTKAVHYIGRAQHPVADMTSPLHAGFQVWDDILTVSGGIAGLNHHRRETPGLYDQQGGYPANFVRNVMDGQLDAVLKP